MLNFPVPYPEEIIYSTVARAGVHFGITSPKRLLDEAFGNRMVVATVDLPSHLETLSKHYPQPLGLTPEQLAYKHTLLPLYAPFVSEARRQKCCQSALKVDPSSASKFDPPRTWFSGVGGRLFRGRRQGREWREPGGRPEFPTLPPTLMRPALGAVPCLVSASSFHCLFR